ncbi:MAG: DUF190 domain-containing protein [Solirubrobacteraceae bacterium]
MSGEYLKLTAYFGERDRTPDGLLGDTLLDIYGARRLHTSVLLRGAEGFGAPHHFSSDRLLSLSEDLPMAAIAVDTCERIQSVRDEVMGVMPGGLLTVEKAQLLTDRSQPLQGSAEPGEAIKLTVYVGRHERVGRVPAHVAVTGLLHRHGVAGASVLLGVDGTRRGQRARATFFARNAGVPLMIIAVGARTSMVPALAELRGVLSDPLMTLERVRVCKRDGTLLARPPLLCAGEQQGQVSYHKLMVYTSHAATRDGQALHRVIVRRLRQAGASGATALHGIWGFHGAHAPHGDRLMRIARHVPVVTVTVNTPQRSARAFEVIHDLTAQHGLVTSETVSVTPLGRPPGAGPTGHPTKRP